MTKFSFLENMRNYGIIISSIIPSTVFLIVGLVIKNFLKDTDIISLLLYGQFLPMSLMLLVLSFSFTLNISSFTEKRQTNFFNFLSHTDVSNLEFYIGTFIAMLLLFNVFQLPLLLLFLSLVKNMYSHIINLSIASNIIFIVMYPLGILISLFIKSISKVNAIMTPVNLILMFSISMPTLFASLLGKEVTIFYKYLFWNPLIILNDFILFEMNISEKIWLSKELSLFLLFILFFVFTLAIYCLEKRRIQEI
jgi:ABC transporter permease protein